MSKEQIVSDAKMSFVTGQDKILNDVMGSVYDQAAIEQKAADGTLSQSDLDAAVAAAVAPLNDQIVALTAQDELDKQAAVDAKAMGDAAVAAIQAQFDELKASKDVEDGVIANLNASMASIQGALDALHALFPQP